MAENKVRKGGKKGRKIGRNKAKAAAYLGRGQREINKVRKLVKHVKGPGFDDTVAHKALGRAERATRGKRMKRKLGKQK